MKITVKPIGKAPKALDLMPLIETAMKEEADLVYRDYQKTVATWRGKPDFLVVKNPEFGYDVYTNNPIYGYLDEGTEAHVIRAKNYPTLRFPTAPPFRAKSKPKVIGSSGGTQPTTGFRSPVEVNHPGIQAREWTKLILAKSRKRLTSRIVKLLRDANRRQGL